MLKKISKKEILHKNNIYNIMCLKGSECMNRKHLKQQAKGVLKTHYWKIFALLLIVSLLSFKFVGFSSETTYSYDYTYAYDVYYLELFNIKFQLQPSPIVLAIAVISGIAGGLYSIFFGSVFNYGEENKLVYYAMGRENEFDLFDGFRKNYKNIVITNFMAGVFIMLWSLLLIIPGVIKAYEYFYVNQILEEHPDWHWKKVLKESKRMTQGHKWELFILELSFILWRLLFGFIPVIGDHLIKPYPHLTNAFAYLYLKQLDENRFEPEMITNESML